jgi:hypothetical protein
MSLRPDHQPIITASPLSVDLPSRLQTSFFDSTLMPLPSIS